MKTYSLFFIVVIALFIFAFLQAQNNDGEKLYQEALFHLEGTGDYAKAIELLNRIVKEHTDNKPLASRALLKLGISHEKLGEKEAKTAYRRIIEDYSDQREIVLEARSRLLALAERAETAATFAVKQVWSGSDVDILGRISPDGTYLSFVDWSTGDLAVRDLQRGENKRLTDKGTWFESGEFALYSFFTPDGKKIIYNWYNDNESLFDLRIIDRDGDNEQIIFWNEQIEYIQQFDISPDGKTIVAVLSSIDRTNQLALVSLEDKSVQVLKSFDWRYPNNARFSPDGNFIAYDFPPHEERPERNIYLLATDGSSEAVIIDHPSDNQLLEWAADENVLMFVSDRSGSYDAWGVQMNGKELSGDLQVIKQNIGNRVIPMGNSHEGSMYFGNIIGSIDVYVASIDIETGATLRDPEPVSRRFRGFNLASSWSPDGKSIAYRSTGRSGVRPQEHVIMIHNTETGQERELIPDLNQAFTPTWTHDGKALVFHGEDKKRRQGIFMLDLQSTVVTPLAYAEPGEYLRNPEWHPDGHSVIYIRNNNRSGIHSIMKMDLETNVQSELVTVSQQGYTNTYSLSPDGNKVAYLVHEGEAGQAVFVRSLDEKEEMKVLEIEPPASIPGGRGNLTWTSDGNHILFVKNEDDQTPPIVSLWSVRADGDGELRRFDLSMVGLGGRIRMHPDGKQLTFTSGRNEYEVWKMENFLTRYEEKDIVEN